ncbi:hypothetical protein ACHAWF_011878 [Thalassiosira exigua]
MAKAKGKQGAIELGPESDPKILFSNYLKECKLIGIEPYGPLKDALTNDENPNIGKQLVVLPQPGGEVLGPGGCRALVNAILNAGDTSITKQVPFTAMKEIRICSSGLGDAGAASVASLLMATAQKRAVDSSDPAAAKPEWKLDYLELVGNEIGRNGCLALGRSLCVGMNKTVVTLVLDMNPLGLDGVSALCKGLSTNSTLKKLSLKHCNIDEQGGKAVGQMLSFKRLGLMELDLTSNQMGGIGLGDICNGLEENASIKTLRLGDNSIGQADNDLTALQQFATVLAKHPSIVAVDIMHNRIGTEGGTLLLPAIRDNKQLTEFKVDSNMDGALFKSLFRVTAKKAGKKGKKKSKKK